MSTLTQFQREPQIIKNYNNFVLKYTSGENSENNQDVEKSHLVVNWWHRRGRRMPMLRIFFYYVSYDAFNDGFIQNPNLDFFFRPDLPHSTMKSFQHSLGFGVAFYTTHVCQQ